MKRLTLALLATAAVASVGVDGALAQAGRYADEWPTYGHDSGSVKFSPLTQITPANVTQLKPAWIYNMRKESDPGIPLNGPLAAAAGAAQTRRYTQSSVTPLVVEGVMYITTPYGRIVALDPTTGREVWVYDGRGPGRGLEYWPGDAQHGPRLVFGAGGGLMALDARTGRPAPGFNAMPAQPGAGGGNHPPVVYKNIVISGTANPNNDGRNGDVRAFDVVTGKQLWRFATVPERGQPGYETWAPGSAERQQGVRVWGGMSVDAERGIVFMPIEDPTWDRFGGNRIGDNLYGTSVVALDANTGKYLWHFQMIRHSLWDMDASAPPALFDVRKDGEVIPAVAAMTKGAIVYILDRRNGKPIFGVEDRPVARSPVPGEVSSPTQPFPVKPPPLARQSISMDEISKLTPEHEKWCKDFIAQHNIGLGGPFNPPGWMHGTVNFPSAIGASNYPGFSYNPDLGYLFLNTQDMGQVTGIGPRGSPLVRNGVTGGGSGGDQTIPYDFAGLGGRFKNTQTGLLCNEGPWGTLTAVNVHTGDIAWRVPLGVTESLPADKQKTGRPNLGGTVATASGLVFVGATDDSYFRAFDARTGRELWAEKIPAPSHSVPITYLGKNGKQYVVFPATGGSFLEDPAASDALMAYALP